MGASSAYDIQSPGAQSIFSALGQSSGVVGSSSLVGAWKRVHPDITRLTFQARLGTSTIGATASSSGVIELSQDGVTPIKTVAGSFQLTATTDLVADGITLPTSLIAMWPYVRFNMQSLSSATAQDTASSIVTTGQASLNVTVAGGWRF